MGFVGGGPARAIAWGTSFPASPKEADCFYRTDLNELYIYDGTNWVGLAPIPHGAADHTDVTRELFIPATEGYVDAGARANIINYGVVSGGANLDEPKVFFVIKVPDDFVSFISLKAVWFSPALAGKNIYWRLSCDYGAAGEAYDTHFNSPVIGTTSNGGWYIINVQEPANPLTLIHVAKGDYLGFVFIRAGSNILDTLDATFYLLGLLFTYTAEQ